MNEDAVMGFMMAARKGDLSAVARVLEEHGSAVVDVRGFGGATALMLASHKSHSDLVQLLLRHGANPGLADEDGRSVLGAALRASLQSGQVDCLYEIVKSSTVDLKTVDGIYDVAAHAAQYDSVPLLRALFIERGLPVVNKSVDGSPQQANHLTIARSLGAVQLMLDALEGQYRDCPSTLHDLLHDIFESFVKRGDGRSSLPQSVEVLRRCARVGSDKFRTPLVRELFLAIDYGSTDSVREVLKLDRASAVCYNAAQGSVPLCRAAEAREWDKARIILEEVVNIVGNADHSGPDGVTALMRASRHVQNDDSSGWGFLEHLLDIGADVNARTACGDTPLHWCATEKAVTMLLSRGAVHSINLRGESAYHAMLKRGADSAQAAAALLSVGVSGTCSICEEESEEGDLESLEGCGHYFCCECLEGWVESELSTRLRPLCPSAECNCEISYGNVRKLARPALFERYDRNMMEAACTEMREFRWCPKCRYGGLMACAECECPECAHKWCGFCLGPAHENGSLCMELESEQWKQKNARSCPGCNVWVEHGGGCTHMSCRRCGMEWCWACGGKYKGKYSFNLDKCPC